MNCIQSFIHHAAQNPERVALWNKKEGATTFKTMRGLAVQMQSLANSFAIQKGNAVLIFGKPTSALYAAVIGLLGLGIASIFIEPWMALLEIEEIIEKTKPKMYVTNLLGRLWGMRSKAIRNIPTWISLRQIKQNHPGDLTAEVLSEEHVGLITFTTGTTGKPKGVVRTHGVLQNQCQILSKVLSTEGVLDLCVLPNFVFLNLSLGRSSIFLSPNKPFPKIPKELAPMSVSCGPGFLKKLIENADYFPELKSFHIGGALAECSLYEKGFEKWPASHWIQIYGSSEAEPVAIADAREVVVKCKEKSFHQTLYLGALVSEIEARLEDGLLWVRGHHVSPFYFGSCNANKTHKKKDASGQLWHNMGDRILIDEEGLWYQGRSSEQLADFILEQEISTFLKTNDVLIANHQFLLGMNVKAYRDVLLKRFPVLKDVIECKIYRDRRHLARIDREKTIQKGARLNRWLIYMKKRFPLIPQIILTGGMALIADPVHSWTPFAWAFSGLFLFFFLLRAMDEYKDFEKDCIAHPERPLPQGLISRNEMKSLIQFLIMAMFGFSLCLGWMVSLSAGLSYFIVSLYLVAMYHEFNLKRFLSTRPLIYALSHQFIIVSLTAFLIAVRGDKSILSVETLLISMVLFGGFFAYEICRKLDPKAHLALKTYPQIYGKIFTAILAAVAVLILSFCGYFLKVSWILWPIGISLLVALVYYCFKPVQFKIAEKISTLNLLACIYSIGIKAMVMS